jgi:hypothetical protein
MKHRYVFLFLLIGLLVALPVLAACDGEETETPTETTPIPFSIDVTPVIMEDTVAGQSCVFLVTVSNEEETDIESGLVYISAHANGAMVNVGPTEIAQGYVSEVVVVPDETSIGETLTITVEGERDGLKETDTVTLIVQERPSTTAELALEAADMRDKFIPWLVVNYPDLEITDETEWAGAVVYPNTQDTIRYYLFFSEKWEMGVRWQIADGAEDWARIYLRMRTVELAPSLALEIPSVSAYEDPHEITPPNAVWR